MIVYCTGDIFLTKSQGIAHGCNCMGIMGAGVAYTIKNIYSNVYRTYRNRCLGNMFKPGDVYIDRTYDKWIINMATQNKFHDANMKWINKCFEWIIKNKDVEKLNSFAIPRIGCGLGGLTWDIVKKESVEKYFRDSDINVFVYEEYVKMYQSPEEKEYYE